MFWLYRPRSIPRLWCSFGIPPSFNDINRLYRLPVLAHDDRGEFDAPRIQAHADAWRSTESWAIPQYPRYIRSLFPMNISLPIPRRYTCITTGARPRFSPRARQRALHAQLADGGVHCTYKQPTN